MKPWALVLASMALVSCDQRQPKLTDDVLQNLKAAMPGITDECFDKARWGGIEAMPSEVDKCVKMEPPKRWIGLWENGFESSRFCPAPARECDGNTAGEYIWLSESSSVQLPAYNGEDRPPLYAVEFIGRKTAYPGPAGHMGMAEQEIIVDRLISMKRVDRPIAE
jgi:hypothetical protein